MGPLSQRYELGDRIAAGGMGTVWAARDAERGLSVAIKRVAAGRGVPAELRAIARRPHPHIVEVFDHGMDDDGWWFAMERADGTLASHPPADLDGWRRCLGQLLDALADAHAIGVVHRDIKPGNVLRFERASGPVWKLADFGIARTEGTTGDTAGTPHYMAPEQRDGGPVGPWTDLYALGVMVRDALGQGTWVSRATHPDPARRYRRACDAAHGLGSLKGQVQRVRVQDATTVDAAGPMPLVATGAVAPGPAEVAPIADSWRDDRPRAFAPTRVRGSMRALREPPMVGREAERDALWSALLTVVRSGHPRRVALVGPAGVGRQRLMRWLCARAHALGVASSVPERAAVVRIEGPTPSVGPVLVLTTSEQGADEVIEVPPLSDADMARLVRLHAEVDAATEARWVVEAAGLPGRLGRLGPSGAGLAAAEALGRAGRYREMFAALADVDGPRAHLARSAALLHLGDATAALAQAEAVVGDAALHGRALLARAAAMHHLGRPGDDAEQALVWFRERRDADGIVSAVIEHAGEALGRGDFDAAWVRSAAGQASAEHAAPLTRCRWQVTRARAGVRIGHVDAARSLLRQALDESRALGHPRVRAEALRSLASLEAPEAARPLLQEARDAFEVAGSADGVAQVASAVADLDRRAGRFDAAESGYLEALRVFERAAPEAVMSVRANLGLLYLQRGRFEEARAALSATVQGLEEAGRGAWADAIRGCLLAAVEPDDFDAVWQKASRTLAGGGLADPDLLLALRIAEERAHARGRPDQAERVAALREVQERLVNEPVGSS